VDRAHVGPVDYVVVEFSSPANVRDGFNRLLALIGAGLVRVLDLEFVTNADDSIRTLPASDAAAEFAAFDGASSGLLDQVDLDTIAAELAAGTTAAIVVYEVLSVLGVLDAGERGGARIVSEGPVDIDDLDAALQETRS
jgi:hypothetical protein